MWHATILRSSAHKINNRNDQHDAANFVILLHVVKERSSFGLLTDCVARTIDKRKRSLCPLELGWDQIKSQVCW